MEAELVVDAKSTLGEGPVWHQEIQKLFWVDIEGKKINCLDPTAGKVETHLFGKMPGALVPIDEQKLLVAFEDGIVVYNWKTQQLSYKNDLGKDTPRIRANDGKCDPNGNFWIGTMHLDLEPKTGTLYSLGEQFNIKVQIEGRTISNGLAWSSDNQTMYYIDTFENCVYAYDFDVKTSEINEKRTIISIDPELGGLDGMCIDHDNKLWIAHWGGHCIRQWDPKFGEILNEIEIPAPHVTSCTFGGPDLNELYITTARSGLSETQLENFPLSGGLFKVKPNTKGLPTSFFKSI